MRVDLLIASASAGLLVYSGRLLVPTARLRPEDIVAYKTPLGGLSYSIGQDPLGGIVPYPHFPEADTVLAIRDVLDSKIGIDLLVFGTIGSVIAIIAGAFTLSWNVPSSLDVASAAAALASGYGAGWWATTRAFWRGKQELRLLAHCFLVWLEREVGDPKAKGYDFGFAVVGTARHSGFTPLETGDADEKAVADRVVALARKHRYPWRRDDFRQWASEVAGKRA